MKPPSATIKQRFMDLNGIPVTEKFVETVAKEVLLTVAEVNIWLDHLTTVFENRKRGAAKSAAARKAKKQQQPKGTVKQKRKASSKQTASSIEPSGPTVMDQDANVASSSSAVQDAEYYCGQCGASYSHTTAEFWVACDACDEWYCGPCEKLSSEPTCDVYFCKKCLNTIEK